MISLSPFLSLSLHVLYVGMIFFQYLSNLQKWMDIFRSTQLAWGVASNPGKSKSRYRKGRPHEQRPAWDVSLATSLENMIQDLSNFKNAIYHFYIIRLTDSMWNFDKNIHISIIVVNKAKATIWKPSCCFLFKPALVTACNQGTDTLTWIQNEGSCC